MLVNVVVLISLRLYRHSIARKQTRAFTLDATAALRDGRFDEVIATASRNSVSHVATVVAAGVTAFISALPQYTHKEASEVSERAIQRHAQMKVTTSRETRSSTPKGRLTSPKHRAGRSQLTNDGATSRC
jgi:hypothetical protein